MRKRRNTTHWMHHFTLHGLAGIYALLLRKKMTYTVHTAFSVVYHHTYKTANLTKLVLLFCIVESVTVSDTRTKAFTLR